MSRKMWPQTSLLSFDLGEGFGNSEVKTAIKRCAAAPSRAHFSRDRALAGETENGKPCRLEALSVIPLTGSGLLLPFGY